MKIRIGDKVRFLDSTGGGIVRRFSGKDLVMVEDEDGFEIPTLVSQCVAVNDEDDARASGHVKPHEAPRPATPGFGESARATSTSPDTGAILRMKDDKTDINLDKQPRNIEHKGGDTLNLCLAFLPADSRRLSESGFVAYVVNDSNYWVFFTLLAPEATDKERMECRYTGLIEPNTKLQLFSIGRSQVDELDHCAMQLLAFKRDRPFVPQSPMHIDIRLNTQRFFKLHSFTENDYFDEEALIQPVVCEGRPYLPISLDQEAISRGIREKVQAARAERKPLPRPVVEKGGIIEVDLHIHALLDNTAGMDNGAMLRYQLDTFRKTMEQYRNSRGQKIVFIHGKGEGVLRKAILDELKARYPRCSWQDASFQQYGFGATLVTIHK